MRRVIAILVFVTFPASVAAQTNLPNAGEAMNADKCATSDCATQPAAAKEYDFEDDEIEGHLPGPGDSIIVPIHERRGSFIRIRADFVPELLTSVDHI